MITFLVIFSICCSLGGGVAYADELTNDTTYGYEYYNENEDVLTNNSEDEDEDVLTTTTNEYEDEDEVVLTTQQVVNQETTSVSGHVYWYGSSTHPNEVQVNLYGNDQGTGMSTYAHAPNWEYSLGYLPKFDTEGYEIDYIVSATVEGWDTFVIQTSRTGWDVVFNERADHKTEANTETSQTQPVKVETTTSESTKPEQTASSETINVSGRVIWNDHDNEEKIRPEAVTICLLANGTDVAEKMVTSASDWNYTFEGVAKNDNNGNTIKYTVTADPVDGYRFEYNRYDVMGIHGVKSVKTPGVTQEEKKEPEPEQPATTQETVKPQEPQQTTTTQETAKPQQPTTPQQTTTTNTTPQPQTTTTPSRNLPPTGDATSVASLGAIASGMLAVASGIVKKIAF